MFRKSNQKTEKRAPKERDSKKKPTQPMENVDPAKRNMKVKEGATEEKCVAGPVVTRAHPKKSDKVHPLKVKEAMSSIDKSTIENLQKKDSTLKGELTKKFLFLFSLDQVSLISLLKYFPPKMSFN